MKLLFIRFKGFGDLVPNIPYACFTIFYILTGLTTLASSMNLLVLRLATINAEEQVQEKLEAAEAQRQAVHLEGDVISPNTRLLVTQEKPEQYDKISVCSCTCLDHRFFNFERRKKNSSNKQKPGRVKRLFRCTKKQVEKKIETSDDGELVSNGSKRVKSSLSKTSLPQMQRNF